MATNDPCLICAEPADWVRKTQFAGDHPFCEEHAKAQPNFGTEDPSYHFWRKLDNEPEKSS